MQLNDRTRITIAICATAIVLGVVAGLVVTGGTVDAGAILGGAGLLLGGLLGGIGAAGGPPPRRLDARTPRARGNGAAVTPIETPLPRPTRPLRESGSTGPLVALLLAGGLALPCSACGVSVACQAERTIVGTLDAGVAASAAAVGPDAGEEWASALAIARGATDLGRAAVGACELARDGAGWRSWVGLALEATAGIVGLISGAAGSVPCEAEVPEGLARAVELLEAEAEGHGLEAMASRP